MNNPEQKRELFTKLALEEIQGFPGVNLDQE
jgi:hypothetical protein